MKKRGISLIVLIVTIIVIIILATAVILTLSKNNPMESAKEATFKEDIRTLQDELAMYMASEYQKRPNDFDKSQVNFDGETLVSDFGMPKKYEKTIQVEEGNVFYTGKNSDEKKWAEDIKVSVGIPVSNKWKAYISSIEDGVPIPKGFTHVAGTTMATGLVIEDGSHNEFVWIPSTESEYKKDFDFPSNYSATEDNTSDPTILSGLDETADVKEYGGFYIGRYEATVADATSNGKPTCKKGSTAWTNISQTNAITQAESMYTGDASSVQSGLLTGKAWDTTCKWIEDEITKINASSTLNDSRFYGNYSNSVSPADSGKGTKHEAGYNENWKTKNIYDLAGNVWEWTYEAYGSTRIYRGGGYFSGGGSYPVSYRSGDGYPSYTSGGVGFRLRLYIKTN